MAFDRNAEEDLAYGHKPVLLDECLTGLNIRPDGIYVDGTLGRAGHSLEIARRLSGGGRLICLDRDETAIAAARERLADYRDRVTLVHSNFSRLGEVQQTVLTPDGFRSHWRAVRPIPERDLWFEAVWARSRRAAGK